jgi:hypothetical protein
MSEHDHLAAGSIGSRAGAAAARQVARRPEHPLVHLQRAIGNAATVRLVAADGPAGGPVPSDVEAGIESARGGGSALDSVVRTSMETGFDSDFSGVRVHTGQQAASLSRALGARAFTTGQDVFFGAGQYQPGSSGGRELLAHELTHVVQQGGAPGLAAKLEVGSSNDPAEKEADEVARAVVQRQEAAAPAREDEERQEHA